MEFIECAAVSPSRMMCCEKRASFTAFLLLRCFPAAVRGPVAPDFVALPVSCNFTVRLPLPRIFIPCSPSSFRGFAPQKKGTLPCPGASLVLESLCLISESELIIPHSPVAIRSGDVMLRARPAIPAVVMHIRPTDETALLRRASSSCRPTM